MKSADAVTRDNAGNIIPLDERFNEASDDIRYSSVNENSPDSLTFTDSSGSIESEVVNANDNGRVRKVSSGESEELRDNRNRYSSAAGNAQESKEWRNLPRAVQKSIQKEVSEYIGNSPNYDEAIMYILDGTGKTIDDISIEEYNAQIKKTAANLYETAMQSRVLAENKFKYLGSDGISKLIDRIISKADEQKFSRVNQSEETKAAIEAYRAQTTAEAKAMKAVYEAERKQIVAAYKKQEHPKGCPCFCLILVINLSAVSRIHDNYHKFPIIDRINNAIRAYPQPIKGIMTLQLFYIPIIRELAQSFGYTLSIRHGQPINKFLCLFLNYKSVCHQASPQSRSHSSSV